MPDQTGQNVPEATSAMMRQFRSRDTKPELALRRELHRRGRRFFVDRAAIPGRRRADLVFPRAKVAVFVDGCFWHSCPAHLKMPKTNTQWWVNKLAGVAARDADSNMRLEDAGWIVVRLWEHIPVAEAADTVDAALLAQGLCTKVRAPVERSVGA